MDPKFEDQGAVEKRDANQRELELRQVEDRIVQRLEKRLPKQRTWRNRLIKYGAIAAVLIFAYFYFFSCEDSPLRGGGGTGGSAGQQDQTVQQTSPKEAVRTVYHYVAGDPKQACAVFSATGKAAFAKSFGVPDCPQAAQAAAAKVTDKSRYANPDFPENAAFTSGSTSEIRSCDLGVTGGDRLGVFILTKQGDGGWVITGHEKEPADCLTG
ncbi:hypothetical protein [Crossiella sp. CA198]|uniref:hypothetical protein n=1 Tax=Crossiella sp. CA198 TaxID=3455607 RepID=UPI003F8D3303